MVGLLCRFVLLDLFPTQNNNNNRKKQKNKKQQKKKTKLCFVTNSSLLINCNKKESDDVNKYTDKSFDE